MPTKYASWNASSGDDVIPSMPTELGGSVVGGRRYGPAIGW